ncbi:hypothetical protein [Streptomyces sp. NPDC005438]|uniref:hypothetical protein n=1 Tax=Streptomyces sp. NPDC005438 TaxID=3156880 RepID=UPI0033B1D338
MDTRYFERDEDGVVRRWRISRDGVHCHVGWGLGCGPTRQSTTTLPDETEAGRHLERRVREKRRQGYQEVTPPDVPDTAGPDREASLTEGYQPFGDEPGVFVRPPDPSAGADPHRYLVLDGDQRRGLCFEVGASGHDPAMVHGFLRAVRPLVDQAFDGRSHHKCALPRPLGRFDHVLLCGPSLSERRYGDRLARALPVLDCEIGDRDTGTVVEARLRGPAASRWSSWDRRPCPVTDLRHHLPGAVEAPSDRRFAVRQPADLHRLLGALATSTDDGWLEVRNYRRRVWRLTRDEVTATTPTEVVAFLWGSAVPAR